MIRLVISNQRGGVAKTTTAVNLAHVYAEIGKKVLLVDTDPQGSVHTILGLKPQRFLRDFLIEKIRLPECVTAAEPNLDVLASNRSTTEAEASLFGATGREMVFDHLFPVFDEAYDVVLIDCAPSVTLFQSCAMMYSRRLLIPVAMDGLSVQGAVGSLVGADTLNRMFRLPAQFAIRATAFIPVMVNLRYSLTVQVMSNLEELSKQYGVPILPPIRTDQAVAKAAKSRQHLAEYDPKSKALEDYRATAKALLDLLGDPHVEVAKTA